MNHRKFQSNNSLLNYHVLLNRDLCTAAFNLFAITKKKQIIKPGFLGQDIYKRFCDSFEEIALLLLTVILTYVQLQSK